ncbi:hypothetical protein EAH74_21820 [Pseudomonas mandelii]|uniref:Uncharacterized protein n=1 Tax=Pseudomonas mandelii TaxID=75612 RepID=A0A502I723_9PSED|nr:hypothetical protein EAH74_21820 [Pseudomonas mandelii]
MRCLWKVCEKSIDHHKTTVGASLLAKAVDQPTLMLTDTAHSRAGSLPQGNSGAYGLVVIPLHLKHHFVLG